VLTLKFFLAVFADESTVRKKRKKGKERGATAINGFVLRSNFAWKREGREKREKREKERMPQPR